MRLTNAGRELHEHAIAIIRDVDFALDAAGQAGSGARGALRIGLVDSFASNAVRDILDTFRSGHPDVRISFVEASRSRLIRHLRDRQLDLIYLAGKSEELTFSSLVSHSEQALIAMPTGHRLAPHAVVDWAQVIEETILLSVDEPSPEILAVVLQAVSVGGQQPAIARQMVGREALMMMVALGLGVTIVSEAGSGVSYPGVVYRAIGGSQTLIPFAAVWDDGNDNPALRRYLSLSRAMMRPA